jgi:two-component system, OmpR family, KDP operon response regulator KdpE
MSSILVVDDEGAMRELYRRLLTAAGYLALDARTAEEGLDLLTLTPDIFAVVADLNMPGQGGEWLVDQLRQRFPNVAVILATANENVPGTLSLQASVVQYIVKPITREQLLAAVAAAHAWHEQRVKAPPGPAGKDDSIESFLDRKLTRGGGDGGSDPS